MRKSAWGRGKSRVNKSGQEGRKTGIFVDILYGRPLVYSAARLWEALPNKVGGWSQWSLLWQEGIIKQPRTTPTTKSYYMYQIVGWLFEVIQTPAKLLEWILFSEKWPRPFSWTYMPPVWPLWISHFITVGLAPAFTSNPAIRLSCMLLHSK